MQVKLVLIFLPNFHLTLTPVTSKNSKMLIVYHLKSFPTVNDFQPKKSFQIFFHEKCSLYSAKWNIESKIDVNHERQFFGKWFQFYSFYSIQKFTLSDQRSSEIKKKNLIAAFFPSKSSNWVKITESWKLQNSSL